MINSKAMLLATLIGFSTLGQADPARVESGDYEESFVHAKVLEVRPVYREVRVSTPVRECWEEPVTQHKHVRHGGSSVGSTLAGGLLGGIIGHQFGRGRGQKVSTALGTIIGAQIGHDAGRDGHTSSRTYTRYEQHCSEHQKVTYEEQLDGYHVTYKYRGKKYRTRMPYDPGERIKLKVTVQPAL